MDPIRANRARLAVGGIAVWVRGLDPGLIAIGLLFLTAACMALTVDVVRTGYGIKGDEATYVAMTLSVAHDGDLVYDSRDIARLYQVYQAGPAGIFLKRGAGARDRPDRLYFGKAYIYSVMAAPLVRVAGLNGMLLFHVLLLAGTVLTAYVFIAARSPRAVALCFSVAFFGVSIVPLHVVFLSPEIFNIACVTVAYFLFFFKEVAPSRAERWDFWLRGTGSDICGAVLLGLVTFSKPTHALLIAPPVLLAMARRRPGSCVLLAAVFSMTAAGAFAVNAVVTGEMNYQGGDRKTFYGVYPFEHSEATFDRLGIRMTTNAVDEEALQTGLTALLAPNLRYFLFGRHSGFVPYFFPGVVVIVLFLTVRRGRSGWQWAALCAVAATGVALSGFFPYSWSGGGGPPGNRYFVSIYPALLFLVTPHASFVPSAVAWAGGALFTAHILMNPFVAAKQPYLNAERGALRALPVELTMVDNLPIALDASRHRIRYPSDPQLRLSLLDRNVQRSGALDLWVSGDARADLIVQSSERLTSMTVTLRAPVANRVTVSLGGDEETIGLSTGIPVGVMLRPAGVHARGRWEYLLSVRTSNGMTPRLYARDSPDTRFLGVVVGLQPHVDASCTAC